MQYIIAIGIFQALVATGLLWKSKLRSSADGLLILLVACIGTHLAIKFVIFNFVQDAQVRGQMNTFIGFCYGPLLYLYTLKVKDPGFIPASKWYVFLPFVAGAIAYFTVAGILFVANASGYYLLKQYNQLSFWTLVPSDLFFSCMALYHMRQFPDHLHKERQMISRIAGCFLGIALLSVIFYMVTAGANPGYPFLFRSVIYGMLVGLIVLIVRYKYVAEGNNAFAQMQEPHAVLDELPAPASAVIKIPAPEPAVKKAGLSEEDQQIIWQQLEAFLNGSRIFADSELNLDKLAQATGINKYHISETLNSYAHKSFYQYINEYRIQFALSQMQRYCEQSVPVNVLSLAYDAGFKAKSSFNRYFKEITGVTPTEYLKSLQQAILPEGLAG